MLKLECPICFQEDVSFKILDCGHHFCSKCIDQLRTAPIPSAPVSSMCSTVSASETPSTVNKVNTRDMECPQCRQITPASSLLKRKFMGTIFCRQCDEEKMVEEFRWCIQCTVAICSKCFVDKHMSTNSDGMILLHPACKWDADFPVAKHCIEQLKREIGCLSDQVKKTQDYAKSYLEGFQEYLFREIEQKIRLSAPLYESKIASISDAYGIDAATIAAADQCNKNYDVLLSDLFKVAKIEKVPSPADNFTETQLKLKCLPYKDMANILLGGQINNQNGIQQENAVPLAVRQNSLNSAASAEEPMDTEQVSSHILAENTVQNDVAPPIGFVVPPVGFVLPPNNVNETTGTLNVYPTLPQQNAQSGTNGAASAFANDLYDALKGNDLLNSHMINRKLSNTIPIGLNVIKQPADISYLPDLDTLLISDYDGGIFTCSIKNQIMMHVTKSDKRHYSHYSRITLLPENIIGTAAMVNVQIGAAWYYTVVSIQANGVAQQTKLPGKNTYNGSFPSKFHPTVASSNRSLFCLASKTLYRFCFPQDGDWKEMYTVPAETPHSIHQNRLGPILDRNECTIVFVTNGARQSIDVITLSHPENNVLASRRIMMQSFFGTGQLRPFMEPYLVKFDDKGDILLVADKKKAGSVFAWNRNEETFTEWYNFGNKIPQKIICTQGLLCILSQQKDSPFLRSLEMVRI